MFLNNNFAPDFIQYNFIIMRLKNILFLAIFFLTVTNIYCQKTKVKISGMVLTADGKPAEGVSVALKGTTYAALTNGKGEYVISTKPGNYILVVSYIGFKSKLTELTVGEADKSVSNITIEEDTASLNEVQVIGKSQVERINEKAYNVVAIDLKQLYNSNADLNKVLGTTTGVRVRETGGMGSDFKFSLNGFTGNQVKFFMDGIPIDSYGSSFSLNNIPVNLAERIEVYKGVVPVELGSDALGGAVNIVTNPSVKRYIDASYSFGSFNTHRVAVNTRFMGKNGLVANINAFGNYTDNNYKVDVQTFNSDGTFNPERKYEHFHDGYKSGAVMAEIGVKGKKYADYLLFGLMASANKKQIQTGTNMQRVVGQAFNDSKAFVPSLKFKKDSLFTKNLSVNFIASYNIVKTRAVDTSSLRYKWDGTSVASGVETSGGELNMNKSIYVFDDKSFQVNTTFKYDLNEQQYFALNYSINNLKRKEDDEFYDITRPGEPSINKNIIGLSYNLAAFDRKMSFTAFAKKYFLKTTMVVLDDQYADEEDWVYNEFSDSFDDIGYGAALSFFLNENLQLKASYEHAFRLPIAEEMLGDGLLVLANPNLLPESSDNINAGFSFKKKLENHSFGFQGNYIYRNAQNFIQAETTGAQSNFINKADVRVSGIDGTFQYGYKNSVTFEVNATYQKTIDESIFDPVGSNTRNADKGYQIANTPIFYGNANLGFNFRKIRTADDNLSINLLANYIDEYFLVSTRNGSPDDRNTIPEQFTQSINTAYTFGKGKYNIGLECNNITDTKVYDYYKVQKPGRSFMVKFRYFIN
ncbi:TonB-dependent receptor [Flavobacterium sp. ARAG 55.4]|uniref:TonB-dependent receptor n=1 Tax=Flavobacterium sp. ARAG 55.4 TaxID=3451357 RepID=UPI003F4729D0